jgi:hypothetical protein
MLIVGECLVTCMKERLINREDSTDLLIGGVEVSLWVAEQWAADLRTIFPQLNVITVSSNKLLGIPMYVYLYDICVEEINENNNDDHVYIYMFIYLHLRIHI